jgi:heparanase
MGRIYPFRPLRANAVEYSGPINTYGLLCATMAPGYYRCERSPDRFLGADHPEESYSELVCRCQVGHSFRFEWRQCKHCSLLSRLTPHAKYRYSSLCDPMKTNSFARSSLMLGLAALGLGPISIRLAAQVVAIDPGKMSVIGTVDEHFESYNIEMVEVTGGRFWKPYSSGTSTSARPSPAQPGSAPSGLDPSLFEYRPPIDLANSRLRKLAAALGPAYVRVSGTWANSVYFHDSDDPQPADPPAGFNGVLTRKEWKGVIDFAHAVNAEIVTSFATSVGTRDANGIWTPEQARKFLAYTKSAGGRIAAAEFMNEPNLAAYGGGPKGYDAVAYARDLAIFRPFLKENSPETVLLGPGSAAEGPLTPPGATQGRISTEDLLKATGPIFDVFSYHLYAAVSQRCAKMGAAMQTTATDALSPEWLSRSAKIATFYAGLRDRFEPGKPLWITETADAACGGNPWASTFLDAFRYLIQHGTLAQQRVKIIMHNTLAASDYGLLDEKSFAPRPNYWAALLWRKLMGSTVLDAHLPSAENVYTYAQCLRDQPGGVTLLIVNADDQRTYQIKVPSPFERYTLTAAKLEDTAVRLNGTILRLDSSDDVPKLTGEQRRAGQLTVAPRSVAFVAIAKANSSACR